jgi:hypothetical protein
LTIVLNTQENWRAAVKPEERQAIRAKMKAAFQSSCGTFDQLVDTAAALEEELLHVSCVSRLDYFKNGLESDKRVALKRKAGQDSTDRETAAVAVAAPKAQEAKKTKMEKA